MKIQVIETLRGKMFIWQSPSGELQARTIAPPHEICDFERLRITRNGSVVCNGYIYWPSYALEPCFSGLLDLFPNSIEGMVRCLNAKDLESGDELYITERSGEELSPDKKESYWKGMIWMP